MTNPEQTLPVVAIMVAGYGEHGYAASLTNRFDKPANGGYWTNRGYHFAELTPLTDAEVEITRLTAERDAALADARRLREASECLLSEAVILSDEYLSAFSHWADDQTIQGWDKARWLRASAAAKNARAALAATGEPT